MLVLSRSRPIALGTLLVFSLSCATTQLPPISAVGEDFEPLKDEARLWERSRAEEKELLAEVPLYDDPLLEDYLEEIVADLNPPGMRAADGIHYDVRVIEDPTLNAFAYPHGSLYVHTGLLARMRNEHQLATVLAHEMTHVENRHTVRYHRSARNKQVGLSIAAIAAAVVLANEQGDALRDNEWSRAATIGVLGDVLVSLGLQLAFLASVNGYGRRLEAEADQGGFEKMARAGYDLRESPKVYQALLEDKGSDPGDVAVFFFGSHPKLSQRIESAEAYLAAQPDLEPATDAALPPSDDFSRRLRPVVRDDARLNIERGRFDLAEEQIDEALTAMPEDPRAHLLLAELYLAHAKEEADEAKAAELTASARASLGEALRLDPDLSRAHRELGLLAYKAEEWALACTELRAHLATASPSEETRAVEDYVRELERDGRCAG